MTIRGARPILLALALMLCGRVDGARAQNIDFVKIELQTVKVADGLYVLMGGPAQGNIAVSVGSDGVFLVTIGTISALFAQAGAVAPGPGRY